MLNEAFGSSPFPGMNPYLEGPENWSDCHATFVHALREALNERLPPNYYARVGELVITVASEQPEGRTREPDVFLGKTPDQSRPADISLSPHFSTTLLEPIAAANVEHLDPHTELFIEVLRMPEREVVTVIELFSPTNKYGAGRTEYAQKRVQLLRTPANLVELDLLRAGRRMPVPKDDYFCFISPGDRRPSCDVYHWSVRDLLPTLPIPLQKPDSDVLLPLAGPFKTAFARGQYSRFIDYTQPPPPPAFPPEAAAWLAQLGLH